VDLVSLIAPPLCLCCRKPLPRSPRGPALCRRCAAAIERDRDVQFVADALDSGYAALPYERHGRRLVAALKFSRLLPVAELGAALIAAGPGAPPPSSPLVPIPPSPLRELRRGFDPAAELAAALARLAGGEVLPLLCRRDLGRQRGRSRGRRIADPPRLESLGPSPQAAVIVDDVVTTGATVTAAARALRAVGARRVDAIAIAAVPSRG